MVAFTIFSPFFFKMKPENGKEKKREE